MPANNVAREALAGFLQERGIDPGRAIDRLEAYEQLIRRWNARGNLVSRGDLERLRDRHVLDSLNLLPRWKGSLADVGSGAGFPGMPLAIVRPEASVTLIERSERKTQFLRQVVIELGLPNVDVIRADIGHRQSRGSLDGRVFDTVTARAVAPPPAAWELLRGLLRNQGVALFQSAMPLQATLFRGGEIRACERAGLGWVTIVGIGG